MKQLDVTIVRVYLTESEAHVDTLLKRLHEWGKVRGVTVFRGIAGFGPSGTMHGASLVDISLDLPVVVEFFDVPDKAQEMIDYLYPMVKSGHVVSWPAQVAVDDGE
jgi:PII-like signaling protein